MHSERRLTYLGLSAHACLARVGIAPPAATIGSDDKRAAAHKPAPDAFLLAAEELGASPRRCVVFGDSPAGIRAGLDAGAVVVAVCSRYGRGMIAHCGAHAVVDTLEQIRVVVEGDGLKFVVLQ